MMALLRWLRILCPFPQEVPGTYNSSTRRSLWERNYCTSHVGGRVEGLRNRVITECTKVPKVRQRVCYSPPLLRATAA